MVAVPKRGRGRPVSLELTAQGRNEIITGAARFFAERGYHATTLDSVTRELGSTNSAPT